MKWVAFGVSVICSMIFLIGLWLFSYRYLVTSIEINYLFNLPSKETLKRFDCYNRSFWFGVILSVLLGPFQYSDFAKLKGI